MDTTSRLIDYLLLKGECARARDPQLRSALQACLDQARHKLANAAVVTERAKKHALYRHQMAASASEYLKPGRVLSTRS